MLRLVKAEAEWEHLDAESVRERVYAEEERMRAPNGPAGSDRVRRPDDTNLLVYAGSEPVGTVRLRVVKRAAGVSDSLAGVELASKFRFRGFEGPRVVIGEVGGFCILRRHRGSRVAALLFAALRGESQRRGVTHWLAVANTETDSAEDAAIAYRLLRAKRLVSPDFRATARKAERPPLATRFIYTAEERGRAARGDLHALRLPKVLALFAGKMGARYIGQPVYHSDLNVFATPLTVELSQLGSLTAGGRAT